MIRFFRSIGRAVSQIRRDRAARVLYGPAASRGVYVCNDRHRMILLPVRAGERPGPVACPLCGAVSALVENQLAFVEIITTAGVDGGALEHARRGFGVSAETVRLCVNSNASR